MRRLTLFVIGVAALALVAPMVLSRGDAPPVRAQLITGAAEDAAGFAHADGPRAFRFPEDHGPHPDYQTEWWYYTGNLEAAGGRRFGYQLTFFRRAMAPPAARAARASAWAADQVYLAHFAVSDVDSARYQAFERFARGAAGLAGAESPPYRVWLEDWRVDEIAPGVYQMRAAQGGLALDLTLTDAKGPALQGDRGYSQKGSDPGNASYYYSLTRLETAGAVRVGEETFAVSGLSWMDHEFSTSALAPNQVGWDWFALQLDDGTELKVFHLRNADGGVDPFSSGSFVAADGAVTRLRRDDFSIDAEATWDSPHSGAVYPARWTVTAPALGLTLRVEPLLADQELNVSYTYWEGAVRVEGERAGQPVRGQGYVELTGYAASMQGQF
ncbi:MAG: carotenoid 1,2-hydratase [Anaerolineae bacterium]|nr:carotenoid 1,2-hydratase [Anaerolineae bacterium]